MTRLEIITSSLWISFIKLGYWVIKREDEYSWTWDNSRHIKSPQWLSTASLPSLLISVISLWFCGFSFKHRPLQPPNRFFLLSRGVRALHIPAPVTTASSRLSEPRLHMTPFPFKGSRWEVACGYLSSHVAFILEPGVGHARQSHEKWQLSTKQTSHVHDWIPRWNKAEIYRVYAMIILKSYLKYF